MYGIEMYIIIMCTFYVSENKQCLESAFFWSFSFGYTTPNLLKAFG